MPIIASYHLQELKRLRQEKSFDLFAFCKTNGIEVLYHSNGSDIELRIQIN